MAIGRAGQARLRNNCPMRVGVLFLLLSGVAWTAGAESADSSAESPPEELRYLDPSAPDYQTPRAGEGFRTNVFGRDVTVDPRDRRSTTAWDVGFALWYPSPEFRFMVPFASAYVWRRPEDQFFRGTFAVLYNELLYAHALAHESPFEVVLGFENSTNPFSSSERIDGERINSQALRWGYVHGAVGLGYRRQLKPGFYGVPGGIQFLDHVEPRIPDNMFSVSVTAEPK